MIARRGQRRLLPLLALCCLGLTGCSGVEEVPVFGPGAPPWTASDPRWRVEWPLSGVDRPLAACMTPDGEAWVVGTGGLVLHHGPRGWQREPSGVEAALTAVTRGPEAIWAVGGAGTILRREAGGRWRREASGVGVDLRAMAIAQGGTLWAGGGGSLLHRGPNGWSAESLPISGEVTALAARNDSLLVGCSSGEFLQREGEGWRVVRTFAPFGISSLCATSGGAVYVSAERTYRLDGSAFPAAISGNLCAASDSLVFMSAGNALWGVQPTGLSQRTAELSAAANPAAVAFGDATHALAVTDSGHLWWWGEHRWSLDPAGALASGALHLLADGTLVAESGNALLARLGCEWAPVRTLPPGSLDERGSSPWIDGASLGAFCYQAQEDTLWLWRGAWSAVDVPTGGYAMSRVTDASGVPLIDCGDAIRSYSSGEWRVELTRDQNSSSARHLARMRDGTVWLTDEDVLFVRRGGAWTRAGRMAPPARFTWYNFWNSDAVGSYPLHFVLICDSHRLEWVPGDTLQTRWRRHIDYPSTWYLFGLGEANGQAVATEDRSGVTWSLSLDEGAAANWEPLSGPCPAEWSDLAMERWGDLVILDGRGHLWIHPGVSAH